MTTETHKPDTTAAATNVPELIAEIDAGMFERMFSIALSQTAAAVVDREKPGEITIKLKIEHIKGTHQVRMGHSMKFTKPTMTGKAGEESSGATVLFVGRFGKLSLAQPSLLDKSSQGSLA